jgi:hypothetical protein
VANNRSTSTGQRDRLRLGFGLVFLAGLAFVALGIVNLVRSNNESNNGSNNGSGNGSDTQTSTPGLLRPILRVDPNTLGGLVLPTGGEKASYSRRSLERKDTDAAGSPDAVVVRRKGFSLGMHSVVISTPPPAGAKTFSNVDSTLGVQPSVLVADRPGGRVMLKSTLVSMAELKKIAEAIRVENDKVVIESDDDMSAYDVISGDSLAPASIRESRYGCDSVGEKETLVSLCYTGLTTLPGFESALLDEGFTPGPLIGQAPSVLSKVGGGNATLAWELAPGIVAYVGYSGSPNGDEVAALKRLAMVANPLTETQWLATTPQVVEQNNAWNR